MRNVLIFGCGGFVGAYLAQEFLDHGYHVIGVDINSSEVLNKYVTFEIVDLLDTIKVDEIIAKYTPVYLVNLAAISSVGNSWNIPQKTIEVNVNGTLNILESVRKHELKTKSLLVGSSEEYALSDTKIAETHELKANNPYGISKVMQENFAVLYRERYGLNIINVRTFNHAGYGQSEAFVIPSFVKQVAEIHKSKKDGIIYVGNLTAIRDFGDVRDMARAYRMILESTSNITVFNVGGGISYELGELLEYIVSLTPQHIEIKADTTKFRPIDTPVIQCDNSLIIKEVGWEPRYTLFDAIDIMFEKYISNKI